jgi:hypothetical protein
MLRCTAPRRFIALAATVGLARSYEPLLATVEGADDPRHEEIVRVRAPGAKADSYSRQEGRSVDVWRPPPALVSRSVSSVRG